jgi:hypothetical protein
MKNQLDRHLDWLIEISNMENAPISHETASIAKNAIESINETLKIAVKVPETCTGPNGELSHCWNYNEWHLELEITSGNLEWFVRNRITGQSWIEEWMTGNPLSNRIFELLYLLPC